MINRTERSIDYLKTKIKGFLIQCDNFIIKNLKASLASTE